MPTIEEERKLYMDKLSEVVYELDRLNVPPEEIHERVNEILES